MPSSPGFPLVLGSLVLLGGCARIMSGGLDVEITSVPDGAIVFLDGRQVGVTPYVALFDRETTKRVVVKVLQPQFGERTVVLERDFNWWFLGNLALVLPIPVVIGIIVDLATDSVYTLYPLKVEVDFHRPPKQPDGADEGEPRASGGSAQPAALTRGPP